MFSALRRRLYSLLAIYLLVVAAVFFSQRQMLFVATRAPEEQMVADGKGMFLDPWRNEAGAIIGWHRGPSSLKRAANKLIVFHGNAGNAIYRSHFVNGFESLGNGGLWEVWILEYPGYGSRPGEPSRDTIDGAALDAVQRLKELDDRPVYVLGESLGSGAACAIAASEAAIVKGVVLMTPYARLADVAQARLPFLPSRWILRDRWDNLKTLAQSRLPVAVLIAGKDEVVGMDQGEMLFASLGDRPKRRWLFPEATHNGVDFSRSASWWGEVSDFLLHSHP